MDFEVTLKVTVFGARDAQQARERIEKMTRRGINLLAICEIRPKTVNVAMSDDLKVFLKAVYDHFEGGEAHNPALSFAVDEIELPVKYNREPFCRVYFGKPEKRKLPPDKAEKYQRLYDELTSLVKKVGDDISVGELLGIQEMECVGL